VVSTGGGRRSRPSKLTMINIDKESTRSFERWALMYLVWTTRASLPQIKIIMIIKIIKIIKITTRPKTKTITLPKKRGRRRRKIAKTTTSSRYTTH